MSFLQWMLLIGASMIVIGLVLYVLRQRDEDPWQGLDRDDTHIDHLRSGKPDQDYDFMESPEDTARPDDDTDAPADVSRLRALANKAKSRITGFEEIESQSPQGRKSARDDFDEFDESLFSDSFEEALDGNNSENQGADIHEFDFGLADLAEVSDPGTSTRDLNEDNIIKVPPPPREPEPFSEEEAKKLEDAHSGDPKGTEQGDWSNFSTQRNDPEPLKPEPQTKSRQETQLGLNICSSPEKRSQIMKVPEGEEKIIILHVKARHSGEFDGPALHNALKLCRLQYGMHEIYHRITEVNGTPESVFSVANMVKPGFLNPTEAESFSTVGVSMFMVLPGPIDGVTAFRDMLNTADKIAVRLGGQVLDESRNPITQQSAQYLRDEIAETERRWRLKARQ